MSYSKILRPQAPFENYHNAMQDQQSIELARLRSGMTLEEQIQIKDTSMFCHCSSDDACFTRNHYPRRTVLGIIGRDGAMSQRTSLPSANLHEVPDRISDKEAVFAEPLAAALRIVEQKVSILHRQLCS